MKEIHHNLMEKSPWYNKWHRHPGHKVFHWFVFLAVALVFAVSSISKINTVYSAALQSSPNATSSASSPKAPKISQADDRILVKFKKGISDTQKNALLAKHDLKEKSEIKSIGVKIVNISATDTPEEVIQRIKAQDKDSVDFVEVDGTFSGAVTPNDPSFGSQWHLAQVSAPGAWDISTGASTIIIADIDSGADWNNADLAPRLVTGWNFLNGTNNTQDSEGSGGHGTAVAGTMGAATNNGLGVAGMTWGNPIMPLETLNASDFTYWSDVANAITYAADHNVRVINMSLVGTGDSSTMQSAINYAWNKGVVLVASAGNYGSSAPSYPAADKNVMAVSATCDTSDNMAGFSSFGTDIAVAAPGCGINTVNGQWAGTSFSSPITAGLAALVLSINPSLTNSQVVSLIEQNADDRGAPGWDQYYGYGRVNAQRTLAAIGQVVKDTQAPSVPSNVQASAVSSSQINLTWAASTDNVGVVGYTIYRNGVQIGTSASTSFVDNTVSGGTSYSYTVTAYDAAMNTSAVSSAATATTPVSATSVSVTSFHVSSKTANSATITWTTNIPSTGTVNYGLSNAGLTLSASDGVQGITHTVVLPNLSKFTVYYYQIHAQSIDGLSSAATGVSSFKTARK